MDASGQLIRESKIESEPEAIGPLLHAIGGPYKRVGLEAGPLAQWLYIGLASAGFPVICVETRHMKAALSAQINRTDRNDLQRIGIESAGSYPAAHLVPRHLGADRCCKGRHQRDRAANFQRNENCAVLKGRVGLSVGFHVNDLHREGRRPYSPKLRVPVSSTWNLHEMWGNELDLVTERPQQASQ